MKTPSPFTGESIQRALELSESPSRVVGGESKRSGRTALDANRYNQTMFMKLTLVLVVFGIVAFLVGMLTVPELGEANPRGQDLGCERCQNSS
jgi:hypothetical protein